MKLKEESVFSEMLKGIGLFSLKSVLVGIKLFLAKVLYSFGSFFFFGIISKIKIIKHSAMQ